MANACAPKEVMQQPVEPKHPYNAKATRQPHASSQVGCTRLSVLRAERFMVGDRAAR